MVAPKATRAFNRLPKVVAVIEQRVSAVNRIAAFNIQGRIVQSFGGEKHGRRYTVPGLARRRFHIASAPGEAPAVLFGTFANSVNSAHPSSFQSFVFSTDEKGPYLEFGTHEMEARPSFQPAAEAEKDDYIRAMTSAIRGAAREST